MIIEKRVTLLFITAVGIGLGSVLLAYGIGLSDFCYSVGGSTLYVVFLPSWVYCLYDSEKQVKISHLNVQKSSNFMHHKAIFAGGTGR